jgi:hypothetical protein
MTELTFPFSRSRLAALIAEAHRRGRRRKSALAALGLLGLLVGGGIWAGLKLTSGGAAATLPVAPPGYHLVQARGPVQHVVMQSRVVPQPVSIDVATGAYRPVRTTAETWFDARGGLVRLVRRSDGRTDTDEVMPCRSPCVPPTVKRYWPVDPKLYVRAGSGTFHGHDVLWLGQRPQAASEVERVALDARTHEFVGYRTLLRGKPTAESWVLARMPDVSSDRFWFLVPNQGFGRPLAYSPTADFQAHGPSPFAHRAQRALGRPPLWLGERYLGHRLQLVTIGTRAMATQSGVRLRPTKFVLYDYGIVRIEEFGGRPYDHLQGPARGRLIIQTDLLHTAGTNISSSGARSKSVEIELVGHSALLTRDGTVIEVTAPHSERFVFAPEAAVALAKALRPARASP